MSVETAISAESASAPTTSGDLPEWAQNKIAELNNENAKYRIKARDAAAEATEAAKNDAAEQIKALTDSNTQVESERDSALLETLKLKTALAVGIPGESAADFAGLLQGTDEDELKSHAEKVKAMLGSSSPSRAVDPSQGLSGKPSMTPADEFGSFLMSQLPKKG